MGRRCRLLQLPTMLRRAPTAMLIPVAVFVATAATGGVTQEKVSFTDVAGVEIDGHGSTSPLHSSAGAQARVAAHARTEAESPRAAPKKRRLVRKGGVDNSIANSATSAPGGQQQRSDRRQVAAAAAAPAALLETSSKSKKARGPEYGECEWHGFGCRYGEQECSECKLVDNVTNEYVAHSEYCVSNCANGGSACPPKMRCHWGEFMPRGTFQCIDMSTACCIPGITNAPWPPCDEQTDGVLGQGTGCTPKCHENYTASEVRLSCQQSDAGPPVLDPPTFECISDNAEDSTSE